jgi:hypothetical protein
MSNLFDLNLNITHIIALKDNKIFDLQKKIEECEKPGADIKFIVEDEGGYKHGSYSKPEDAEEYAKEIADDRRIDLFIKKITTEIVDCVIPD